jgi:hypothetical protein
MIMSFNSGKEPDQIALTLPILLQALVQPGIH